MRISHKWLQTYFKKPLPSSEEIANLLTFHIFEVEGIEKKTNDDILDVKVLPDRASYCLSHEGVARELGALLSNNEFMPRNPSEIDSSNDVSGVSVSIEAGDVCDKYNGLRILGLSSNESPEWLKNNLEAVGQRSINFLVDLANFVMLDIGQPMHVFDAEKLDGDIVVRYAKAGEKITTLDGRDVALDSSVVIIADEKSPLAIAGIKGGKIAETTNFSTHVIVEAAHFDSIYTRKASSRLNIKTDSSKRFENAISSQFTEIALRHFVALLKKEDPDALVGEISISGNTKIVDKKVEVVPVFVASALGKDISSDEMLECLSRGSIPARREGDKIAVYPPHYRNDLNIPEDIADEIGRLYGYENIEAKLPEIKIPVEVNDAISWRNKSRNFLINLGFSEIQTYALKDKGEIEIANPLAEDKKFFRSELSSAMQEKLASNLYYADLLGLSKIKLFEFGHVYKNNKEFTSLSIGIAYKKVAKGESVNDEIKEIRDALFAEIGSDASILCTIDNMGGIISKDGISIGLTNNIGGIMEVDFDALIDGLSKNKTDITIDVSKEILKYMPISAYPFIVRDVALFVPPKITPDTVFEVIKRNAGELLVRHELFDVFEKKNKETGELEKTSYGYRLVFQSYEKTLTDDEINKIMDKISDALKGKEGWEVR